MRFICNNQQSIPIIFTARRGRVFLKLACLSVGNDFVVTLSGGDREHIGAVAVGQAQANNVRDSETVNIITNVIAIPEHREDELAKSIACLLATRLSTVVCVVCGIHLEQISKPELKDVMEMSEEMAINLITQITTH